eukprot:CAMPEP_0116836604 /NCGR_PEP_ID=MMETSP0418-20121206/8192_1 /TAXON_ID=1158023 /ORGANISM="Astrosyne radiata, Strain 13vi08-1A" /LENGTH=56 /DNA_ID=CAMNT_0004466399 /DNA_START=1026 /DNA_END=1196 /DNA_ORIENTATION=+
MSPAGSNCTRMIRSSDVVFRVPRLVLGISEFGRWVTSTVSRFHRFSPKHESSGTYG